MDMKKDIGYREMKEIMDVFIESKIKEYSYAYTTGYLQSVLMHVLTGASKGTREQVYKQFKDMVK